MEQIYTIPLNEAFEKVQEEGSCTCPFCIMYNRPDRSPHLPNCLHPHSPCKSPGEGKGPPPDFHKFLSRAAVRRRAASWSRLHAPVLCSFLHTQGVGWPRLGALLLLVSWPMARLKPVLLQEAW